MADDAADGLVIPRGDSGLRCAQCEYNLTGVGGARCPECGWPIDWALAAADEEQRRPGTPAHRARGWRKIDQTLWTVLVMLLAPWRFARQLRADESWAPGLAVALVSAALFSTADAPFSGFFEALLLLLCAATVILAQSIAFASCAWQSPNFRLWWGERFRLWMLVSLYSTCFVASWRFVGEPPMAESWTEANFAWPLNQSGGWEWGVTIIYYWWWFILATVLLVRSRPRWLGAVAILFVFPITILGTLSFAVWLPFVASLEQALR